MEREKLPRSDVPELETPQGAEDREVVQGREVPLHEELGFDSIGQMEQARAMRAALLKEKDSAKADKLRAELKALLDDTDGEPVTAIRDTSIEDLLTSAREDEKRQLEMSKRTEKNTPVAFEESPLEDAIARAEFKEGMDSVTRRAEIYTIDDLTSDIVAEEDSTKRDQLRENFARTLGRMETSFNRREKMLMRNKRSEIESSADPLMAKAEAVKNIYLDSIAITNESLAGTIDGTDESEVEQESKDKFYKDQDKARKKQTEETYATAPTEAFGRSDKQDQEVA